jgi:hypothetical protein
MHSRRLASRPALGVSVLAPPPVPLDQGREPRPATLLLGRLDFDSIALMTDFPHAPPAAPRP